MKTYLANPVQQHQNINVRMPESRKPLSMTIPMGQQRMIGDFEKPELAAIDEQLGPYGLCHVDDIKRSQKKISYILSIGRPVSSAEIMLAVSKNRGALTEEGKQRRIEAAVAANVSMNTEESPLNRMEMSIEEATPGSAPSEEPIGEGFKIDNTLDTSENKPQRRRTVRG